MSPHRDAKASIGTATQESACRAAGQKNETTANIEVETRFGSFLVSTEAEKRDMRKWEDVLLQAVHPNVLAPFDYRDSHVPQVGEHVLVIDDGSFCERVEGINVTGGVHVPLGTLGVVREVDDNGSLYIKVPMQRL